MRQLKCLRQMQMPASCGGHLEQDFGQCELDSTTTTEGGRPKIIFEGYAYVRDKVGREKWSTGSGNGRTSSSARVALKQTGKLRSHLHPQSRPRVFWRLPVPATASPRGLQQRRRSTQQILTQALVEVSPAAAAQLPTSTVLERSKQRTRVRAGNAPSKPWCPDGNSPASVLLRDAR